MYTYILTSSTSYVHIDGGFFMMHSGQLVILGVVNDIESALRSYECKTTAKQFESANSENEDRKMNF